MITDPVTMTALINRTVVLPKEAKLLLCITCLAALQQDELDRKAARSQMGRGVLGGFMV